VRAATGAAAAALATTGAASGSSLMRLTSFDTASPSAIVASNTASTWDSDSASALACISTGAASGGGASVS